MYNIFNMYLWDYNKREIEQSKKGKVLILERLINYGPGNKKIKLSEVKKHWDKLNLLPTRKRLFELLIWNR